jgi:hypothetical protein
MTTSYDTIERPYDSSLNRTDVSYDGTNNGELSGSNESSVAQQETQKVNSSDLSDLWITNWIKSRNYKPKSEGFYLDGKTGYIEANKLWIGAGGIIGGSLDIPDTVTANSFHVDANGNTWWGATTIGSAVAKILNTGVGTFTKIILTGDVTIESESPSYFTDVEIGYRTITLTTADSIQDAINLLGSDGGIIFLKAGTYILTADLTGISKLQIIGENETSTIITAAGGAYSLDFSGTLISSAGTIASITSAVNVTGTNTTWADDSVTAYRDSIFIGTRWYTISVVTDNTHLTLAEAFTDDVALGTYRISTLKTDIDIKNITVNGSTTDGILLKDCRNAVMSNVILYGNSIGLNAENCSVVSADNFQIFACTNEGAKFANIGLCNLRSFLTAGNGTNGVTLNNVKIFNTSACASESNTGDGVNITGSTQVLLEYSAQGNGSNGIEVVSTSSELFIQNSIIAGNTSDGLKLTATIDDSIISNNQITGNGGYGLNIAAATCDNNIIVGNQFATNTTADINNSGTGTLIDNNIPTTLNQRLDIFFGDGSDGDVTTAGDVTLSRDMFYNNLTVSTGDVVYPNGYKIFIKDTLTCAGTGKISVSGGIGGNGAGGATSTGGSAGTRAYTIGTLPTPKAPGAGGTGGIIGGAGPVAGSDGVASGYGFTNTAGGDGGDGGGGGAAGGNGGTAGTIVTVARSIIENYIYNNAGTINLYGITSSGAGGGGGNGGGAAGGGGGGGAGASGGIIWIAARIISTAIFESIGGDGGNGGTGVSGGGDGGGGAGGNGGVIILFSMTSSGVTTDITGGTGGTGANSGGNGSSGYVREITVN